jgi:hypothetical protein
MMIIHRLFQVSPNDVLTLNMNVVMSYLKNSASASGSIVVQKPFNSPKPNVVIRAQVIKILGEMFTESSPMFTESSPMFTESRPMFTESRPMFTECSLNHAQCSLNAR